MHYQTTKSSCRSFICFAIAIAWAIGLPRIATAETLAVDVEVNVAYRDHLTDDAYAQERCLLDIYTPKTEDATPVLVWFHGGGLTAGSKDSAYTKKMAQNFAEQGITVIVPNYRLSPKVQFPTYLEDAAAAVRFALGRSVQIEGKAGLFVGGHSAGAYIASMLAMDSHYLNDAGVSDSQVAGYIPMSGQTMTHFTVAKERGNQFPGIVADDAAPMSYLRKETSPILMLIGSHDWPARLEENRYFVAAMRKVAKNKNIAMVEIADRNHGNIMHGLVNPNDPATTTILKFIETGELPADRRL